MIRDHEEILWLKNKSKWKLKQNKIEFIDVCAETLTSRPDLKYNAQREEFVEFQILFMVVQKSAQLE